VNKVQIGCGDHPLPGFLNCDIAPCRPDIIYLDATERFPFKDGEIDRIFSEHMIEHVPLAGGVVMLAECYRVLAPGGRIRISTPSLEFLFGLKLAPTEETKLYVEWACRDFSPGVPRGPETVINNFVRAWGHQFIWSRDLLAAEINRAGFREGRFWPVGESDDSELRNLENVDRMPRSFLQLETMTIEAEKPCG
jgi:predicted SAM-dependent methyltransferase